MEEPRGGTEGALMAVEAIKDYGASPIKPIITE